MSEDDAFVMTPIGESVYFAYLQAIMKQNNCTQEEAIKIVRSITAIADSVSELDEEDND
jgi:hypothetical protein